MTTRDFGELKKTIVVRSERFDFLEPDEFIFDVKGRAKTINISAAPKDGFGILLSLYKDNGDRKFETNDTAIGRSIQINSSSQKNSISRRLSIGTYIARILPALGLGSYDIRFSRKNKNTSKNLNTSKATRDNSSKDITHSAQFNDHRIADLSDAKISLGQSHQDSIANVSHTMNHPLQVNPLMNNANISPFDQSASQFCRIHFENCPLR